MPRLFVIYFLIENTILFAYLHSCTTQLKYKEGGKIMFRKPNPILGLRDQQHSPPLQHHPQDTHQSLISHIYP